MVFLLTDGYATDDAIGGLEKLQHNNWYKYGLKVALGIGEKFDEELLTAFTGIPELVVTAKAPDKFAKLVETIELTSSQMQSGSMTWFDEQEGREATSEDIIDTKEKELAEAIKHILTMWIYNHSQVENYTNPLLHRYLVQREMKGVTIPIVENKEQGGSYEDVIEIDISDEFTYSDCDSLEPLPKRSLVLFFLVDTSESMSGTKIETLNTTMEELLPELRGVGGATTDIKLAVMTFSDGCKWITEELMSVDDYQYWTRLKAEGRTDLGEAFEELSKKLSKKEFLNSSSVSYAPVIFLLTDGYATDDAIGGLEKVQHNNWYKYGLKVALGIGKKFDEEILKRFTGNPELVVTEETLDKLAKLIKTIAIEIKPKQIESRSMTLTNIEYEQEILVEDFNKDFDFCDDWDD